MTVDKRNTLQLDKNSSIQPNILIPPVGQLFYFYQDSIPVKGISFFAYALRPRVKTSRPFLAIALQHICPASADSWQSRSNKLQYPSHFFRLFQRRFGYPI